MPTHLPKTQLASYRDVHRLAVARLRTLSSLRDALDQATDILAWTVAWIDLYEAWRD